MKKFDLQMYAEAVSGRKLVYLYRIQSEAASADGVMLAFTTENERTKSKDSDSVVTKDGSITVPGATEQEITATSLLAKAQSQIP
jgi:TP901-1 family phage major tail protein